MSLHILGRQTGQQMHVTIRSDELPGTIAEFDTSVDGLERLVAALKPKHICLSITHGGPDMEPSR